MSEFKCLCWCHTGCGDFAVCKGSVTCPACTHSSWSFRNVELKYGSNLHWKCVLVSSRVTSQLILNGESVRKSSDSSRTLRAELSFLYFWPSASPADSSPAPGGASVFKRLTWLSVNTPHPTQGSRSPGCTFTFNFTHSSPKVSGNSFFLLTHKIQQHHNDTTLSVHLDCFLTVVHKFAILQSFWGRWASQLVAERKRVNAIFNIIKILFHKYWNNKKVICRNVNVRSVCT